MSLDSTKFLAEMESDLHDAISFDEFNIALKAIDTIQSALKPESNSGFSQEELARLEGMLIMFRWIAFVNLSDEECLDLIENNLAAAFSIPEFSFEEKLSRRVVLLALDEIQVSFMEKVVKALEKNKMLLTPAAKGGAAQPLSYWLKEFVSFPAQSNQRSNIDEIKFVDQFKSSQSLDKKSRGVLLEVLKIYDLLRNAVIKYRSLPETDDEQKAFEGFNLYKWLPGLDDGSDNQLVNTPTPLREDIEGVGVAAIETGSYMNQGRYTLPDSVMEQAPVQPRVPPSVPTPGNKVAAKKVGMDEVSSAAAAKPSAEILSKLSATNKLGAMPTVTAGNLAAKIQKSKQQPATSPQPPEKPKPAPQAERQPLTTINYNEQQKPAAPSKAAEYLQKQIDGKLHNLDDRVHKKHN